MIGTTKLKVRAQESLQDDGIRDWDDQLIDELNRDYPDWKNPGQTWMVPPVFNVKAPNDNNGELAEMKVYDLLQEFGNTRKEPMFVVHSYSFREKLNNWKERKNDEEKYVKGEHDFVLIHRQQGVVFLQVKAATTTRKFREGNKQLKKDKMSMQIFAENLKSTLKKKVNYELFSCPGYVVMPNCQNPNSALISNGIFLEDCKDVQSFSSWWDNNILPKKSPDQELYNCLVKRFVGLFHGVPYPLGSSIKKSHNVLVWHTRLQLKALLNTAAEQWITGPAGSGKTWILTEKVKQLADKALSKETGEKILVVCYNLPLSKMLKKQFCPSDHLARHSGDLKDLSSVVEVTTFTQLLFDITKRKRGIESDFDKIKLIDDAVKILETRAPQYDHIFVDECQDLIGGRWTDLFQKLLKDDVDYSDADCKHKWFFYDTNQDVGFSGDNVKLKRDLKESSKLTAVLRNTGNIFDQSKKYLKPTIPKIELGHQECGLAIEWDRSLSSRHVPESEGAKEVVKHIDNLRRNTVLEQDICILVENIKVRDDLSSELKALNVQSQNAETLFEEGHKDMVVVESLRRFKGLESKVVILYNPPFFVCEDWPVKKVKELLYIAISRCFCYLVIITSSKGCEALKSNEGMKEGTLPSRQQPRVSPVANSNNLITECKSQTKALFQEPFGKKSMDTQYESGPMESSTKQAYDHEEECETEPAPHQLSAMEKVQYHQNYRKLKERREAEKSRPVTVKGSDLLEPGDTSKFKDDVRGKVFGLLSETVGTNLQYVASHSTTDQSASNVTAVVAQIEYAIYCQRRHDIDTRNYTRDLRGLKQEIANCNTQQKSHENVVKALHRSSKDA